MTSRTPIFLALCLLSLPALAEEPVPKPATQAAESWLKLVDAGSYAESWKDSSTIFRDAVTAQQWAEAAKGVRGPLGKLVSRKLKSATRVKTLPGVPDGDYVVMQYDATFEQKKAAVETITPMLEKDGSWRVSGYFIR